MALPTEPARPASSPPPAGGGGRHERAAPETSPSEVDLDAHVGIALRYAYQRAVATMTEAIRDSELTAIQVSVLARLHQHGPTTQNRLGRSLGMEPANVRDVVQRLRGRGLVELADVPKDRRVRLVSLTEAGRALFAEVWPRAEAANRRTLSALSTAEGELLAELLHRLAAGPDSV